MMMIVFVLKKSGEREEIKSGKIAALVAGKKRRKGTEMRRGTANQLECILSQTDSSHTFAHTKMLLTGNPSIRCHKLRGAFMRARTTGTKFADTFTVNSLLLKVKFRKNTRKKIPCAAKMIFWGGGHVFR